MKVKVRFNSSRLLTKSLQKMKTLYIVKLRPLPAFTTVFLNRCAANFVLIHIVQQTKKS